MLVYGRGGRDNNLEYAPTNGHDGRDLPFSLLFSFTP